MDVAEAPNPNNPRPAVGVATHFAAQQRLACIRLENIDDLTEVFGPRLAQSARDHVLGLARGIAGDLAVELEGGLLSVWGPNPGSAAAKSLGGRIAEQICLTPVLLEGTAVVVVAEPFFAAEPLAVSSEGHRSAEAIRRQARLNEAARTIGIFEAPGIDLRWQPVGSLGADLRPPLFYRAAVVGDLLGDGLCHRARWAGNENFLRAVGFAAARHALCELEDDSELSLAVPLGVEWSSSTAWRQQLLALMDGLSPQVCARLVVMLPVLEGGYRLWKSFARALRARGCSVGCFGFGEGGLTLADILSWEPDAIELAGRFASAHLLPAPQWRIIRHIVRLAQMVSPVVVLPDINSEEIFGGSQALAINWGYGNLVGQASRGRPWRYAKLGSMANVA